MTSPRAKAATRRDPYRPTPSYLYRHRLYRRLLARVAISPFLEVGAGRGEVAVWLAERGAAGVALEPSPRAAAPAARRLAPYPAVEVVEIDFARYETTERYGLILMFEILEHVADDGGFIIKAASLLRPGGRLVLSVPARLRRWGWRDVVTGHLRRYERSEILAAVRAAGLETRTVWSWGWPVINLLRWCDRRKEVTTPEPSRATAASAVTTDVAVGPRGVLHPVFTAVPFAVMDIFLATNLGVGYIVDAEKV